MTTTIKGSKAGMWGWTRACAFVVGAAFVLSTGASMAHATDTLIVLRPVGAKTKKGEKKVAIITDPLDQKDIGELKVGGKTVEIKKFEPVIGGSHPLQLVILLDAMEQIGINEQFDDLRKLISHFPDNTEYAFGYLRQGKAQITQTFTTDRKVIGDALKQPDQPTLAKNDNGDPYQCLQDLANHWPAPGPDPNKLRTVLMITDGIDRYNAFQQSGEQDDPNVLSAALVLGKAGIMPFPFFYMDPIIPLGRSEGGTLEGQSNFDTMTATTQGQALYEGQYAPATFDGLFNRMFAVLKSMAVVTVDIPSSPGKVMQVDVKSSREDIGVRAPDSVTVGNVLKVGK